SEAQTLDRADIYEAGKKAYRKVSRGVRKTVRFTNDLIYTGVVHTVRGGGHLASTLGPAFSCALVTFLVEFVQSEDSESAATSAKNCLILMKFVRSEDAASAATSARD
ncbi:hypothetical protein MHBO_004632, partial [Bonamia ostreae]